MKAREKVYVIAKYDYRAMGSQELDLRKNERLVLLDDSDRWWEVLNGENESGFVPSSVLKRERPSVFDSFWKRVKEKSDVRNRIFSSADASPTGTAISHHLVH